MLASCDPGDEIGLRLACGAEALVSPHEQPGGTMELDELSARAEQSLRNDDPADLKMVVRQLMQRLGAEHEHARSLAWSLHAAEQEASTVHSQIKELCNALSIGHARLSARGVVMSANSLAGAMLGVSSAELTGKPLGEVLTLDERVAFEHVLSEAHAASPEQLQIHTGEAANAQPCWLRVWRGAGDADGWSVALTAARPEQSLAAVSSELETVRARAAACATYNAQLEQQITARARSELKRRSRDAKLRDAERLESLETLAGGFAHDFNNLLVSVMGNAELLRLTPKLPASCDELACLIVDACHKALGVTRSLLMFAGKGKLSMASINLPKTIARNLELLRKRAPAGTLFQFRGCQAPEIFADPTQINQLLTHLLTNAVEATDGTGVIAVEVEEQSFSAEMLGTFQWAHGAEPGAFVVLRIRDSGRGLDEHTRAHMFDPFFSTKFPGRGLGLSAVRGIVQAHHGAIQVHSEPNAGAMFEIALPITPTSRQPHAPRLPEQSDWRGAGAILLVDDDAAVRVVLAKLLQHLGFDVTEANSGREALTIFERAPAKFRLVVLDWIMPEMSGRDTLSSLRALAPELPVLLVSGYNPEEIGAYGDGVICLQKPATLPQLQTALQSLTDTREP